jgi:hypothetical protein
LRCKICNPRPVKWSTASCSPSAPNSIRVSAFWVVMEAKLHAGSDTAGTERRAQVSVAMDYPQSGIHAQPEPTWLLLVAS